jgi:anti-sigma factor RsiW
MSVSREEIMAYVDGELDESTRARITMAALADLDLADQIARSGRCVKASGPFCACDQGTRARRVGGPDPRRNPPAPVIDLAAVRRQKAEEAKAAAKPKVPLMQQVWRGDCRRWCWVWWVAVD